MGGPLPVLEVFRGEPAVLVRGGPLPLVQALEAHRGRPHGDRVEGLLLGDTVAAPGELDEIPRDRLAEPLWLDRDAGLLVQFAGARLAKRLPGVGRAADSEPVRLIG